MDSPRGGVGESAYAPDARRDSPSTWRSPGRLRLTAAASGASPRIVENLSRLYTIEVAQLRSIIEEISVSFASSLGKEQR